MTDAKPGFIDQIKSYPATFWVANTMEIFERMAWYGWFTVMAVYVTGSVATGGLGFSTELRGALQGIVPFFLYFFPIATGALADRYGYKKMFIIAYCVMIVSYYLLGQFKTVPSFFLAFMFVAVGAAIFKPVVVGTVARVTDDSNSATAFGIFYMMVNIGGFAGPIVAGVMRGMGWEYVFVACSTWALVNLVIVLAFYKEPPSDVAAQKKRSLRMVGDNMVEVLGNLRFFITVFVILFALMFANLRVWWFADFTWDTCKIFIPIWLVVNVVWDLVMPAGSGRPGSPAAQGRHFLFKRMHCSNWRFALFLLIMSGFWTAFNQIFYTMPEYIRDFVDTRPVIRAAEKVFGEGDPDDPNTGVASLIATINDSERAEIVDRIELLAGAVADGKLPDDLLIESSKKLLASKVRLTPDELQGLIHVTPLTAMQRQVIDSAMQELVAARPANIAVRDELLHAMKIPLQQAGAKLEAAHIKLLPLQMVDLLLKEQHGLAELQHSAASKVEANPIADQVIIAGRQVNPEFIVNINAGAIVLFQVLISFLMARFHRFTTMIVGMVIASVGIGLSTFADTAGLIGQGGIIWVVGGGIFIFSFGEMMASPTSQEYVGRIAPADKKALYMGYYFVAVALGNLFGGILSGELMGKLTYEMNRPDLMWTAFGAIMLGTAIVFVLYNKFALPRHAADSLTAERS